MGSFIWTHLTNIQESKSASAIKKSLKRILGSDFLVNKWKTDARKFSRYFESSFYNDQLNVGATGEGSLIFSPESYLPRSAMVDITANVFGESLNLLEIGGRMENFEDAIEKLVGPDGYYREEGIEKLLKGLRSRNKREASDKFLERYGKDQDQEVPKGSIYARSLDKDIFYQSFEGIGDPVAFVKDLSNNIFSGNYCVAKTFLHTL